MSKKVVQDGKFVTLAAPYALTSGQGALVGTLFGVAMADIANGANGPFAIEGVHVLAKATGIAWTQGILLYWDNAAKNVTNVTTSNTRIGVALVAAASGDTTGTVRLNGTAAPTGA
jgi:predicted RecA/RadA family phage recombinase